MVRNSPPQLLSAEVSAAPAKIVPAKWVPGPHHFALCCVSAKSLQLCPVLCDPIGCGPPGPSVHGISQARIGVGCHSLIQGVLLT